MREPQPMGFLVNEDPKENQAEEIIMPSTHFTVKYDGEALANHEMDVALLAPALMSMSHLVKEISQIQSKGEYTATLNVKGNIKAGSIVVELTTHAVSLLQQVKDLLISDTTTALLNFTGVVAIIATAYRLIKKFRGASPDKIEKDGENVIMYFDNRKEIVNHVVYQVYNNYEIRKSIYDTVKPLEEEGIDEFSIIEDNQKLITISSNEISSFVPNNISTQLNENVQETILVIESLTFKEKNKWSFNDGNNSIKAMMLDEIFLNEIENGKQFAKNDWLRVLMRKVQIEENGKLKTTYEIIKVIEHIKKEQHKFDI